MVAAPLLEEALLEAQHSCAALQSLRATIAGGGGTSDCAAGSDASGLLLEAASAFIGAVSTGLKLPAEPPGPDVNAKSQAGIDVPALYSACDAVSGC